MLEQSNTVLVCLDVALPKDVIEFNLSCLGPEVLVVGSLLTEEGHTLMLAGDEGQIADLVYLWGEAAK